LADLSKSISILLSKEWSSEGCPSRMILADTQPIDGRTLWRRLNESSFIIHGECDEMSDSSTDGWALPTTFHLFACANYINSCLSGIMSPTRAGIRSSAVTHVKLVSAVTDQYCPFSIQPWPRKTPSHTRSLGVGLSAPSTFHCPWLRLLSYADILTEN